MTLPVPPGSEFHVQTKLLQGLLEGGVRLSGGNKQKTTQIKTFTETTNIMNVWIYNVKWKHSEERKPFFQLNNETAVQLKTSSGWLHSRTTSGQTQAGRQSFLRLRRDFLRSSVMQLWTRRLKRLNPKSNWQESWSQPLAGSTLTSASGHTSVTQRMLTVLYIYLLYIHVLTCQQ